MTLMIPLGAVTFSPTEVAVLLLAIAVMATAAALPATILLAMVGAARAREAGRSAGWNAAWYWLWGTPLTWAGMAGASQLGLGWLAIPVGWLPALAAAALARPSRGLGWSDVRRPVGER